jgi:hypothetical protein
LDWVFLKIKITAFESDFYYICTAKSGGGN